MDVEQTKKQRDTNNNYNNNNNTTNTTNKKISLEERSEELHLKIFLFFYIFFNKTIFNGAKILDSICRAPNQQPQQFFFYLFFNFVFLFLFNFGFIQSRAHSASWSCMFLRETVVLQLWYFFIYFLTRYYKLEENTIEQQQIVYSTRSQPVFMV